MSIFISCGGWRAVRQSIDVNHALRISGFIVAQNLYSCLDIRRLTKDIIDPDQSYRCLCFILTMNLEYSCPAANKIVLLSSVRQTVFGGRNHSVNQIARQTFGVIYYQYGFLQKEGKPNGVYAGRRDTGLSET